MTDAGRKRQMVQTACRLAECFRKWRLRQETSDERRADCAMNAEQYQYNPYIFD